MSVEARPISPRRFARALQDLPVENIYSKAHEIENSIAHLLRSNAQLKEYSDSLRNDTSLEQNTREGGDRDCLDAIHENEIVIERQRERIDLLKAEVERRGGRWHGAGAGTGAGADAETNGEAGRGPQQNGARTAGGGRLTDEELRARMMDRMGDAGDEGDDADGIHL